MADIELFGSDLSYEMGHLLAAGLEPMSCVDYMKHVIETGELMAGGKLVGTGDALILEPDGAICIDLDSRLLRGITPESPKEHQLFPIGDLDHEGIRITREEVMRYRWGWDGPLSEREYLNHKAWRIIARHPDEVPSEIAEDRSLLNEYFDASRKIAKNSPTAPGFTIMELAYPSEKSQLSVDTSTMTYLGMNYGCEIAFSDMVPIAGIDPATRPAREITDVVRDGTANIRRKELVDVIYGKVGEMDIRSGLTREAIDEAIASFYEG